MKVVKELRGKEKQRSLERVFAKAAFDDMSGSYYCRNRQLWCTETCDCHEGSASASAIARAL